MTATNSSIARKGILALAVCSALAGGAAATSPTLAATPAAGPIMSGAGPGWPATLSPSDFVARVTTPGFRCCPEANGGTPA